MSSDRLEQLAIASLNEEDCPSSDDLAAYGLGLLSGNDQLRVAAHVRICPLCQHDLSVAIPPSEKPRRLIARPAPLQLAPGRRGTAESRSIRTFVAADIEIALTIAPPDGEYLRLTGQVLRAGAGAPGCGVELRRGRWRRDQTSDSDGFFSFDEIPEGRYTLGVQDEQLHVQIQALDIVAD